MGTERGNGTNLEQFLRIRSMSLNVMTHIWDKDLIPKILMQEWYMNITFKITPHFCNITQNMSLHLKRFFQENLTLHTHCYQTLQHPINVANYPEIEIFIVPFRFYL